MGNFLQISKPHIVITLESEVLLIINDDIERVRKNQPQGKGKYGYHKNGNIFEKRINLIKGKHEKVS